MPEVSGVWSWRTDIDSISLQDVGLMANERFDRRHTTISDVTACRFAVNAPLIVSDDGVLSKTSVSKLTFRSL